MSVRDPNLALIGAPVVDRAALDRLAAATRPLSAEECMERAQAAGALVDPSQIDRSGPGDALLLWRNESSEAWLNLWWQPRDTGYHDHDGSCVGVYVIDGCARNEALVIGQRRRVREYRAGDTFAFPGSGIHRMEHDPGAITIHVYSPPLRAVGHYELQDGELRREAFPADEPSSPSPALLTAVAADSRDPRD
jgi:Cysteine dioxygenase type I